MPWFLHRDCPAREEKNGKDANGWWTKVEDGTGAFAGMSCSACSTMFKGLTSKDVKFDPNNMVVAVKSSAPVKPLTDRPPLSDLIVTTGKKVDAHPRNDVGGGATTLPSPLTGQTITPPEVKPATVMKPVVLPLSGSGSTTATTVQPFTNTDFTKLKADIDQKLEAAVKSQAEADKLFKEATTQKTTAISNIDALEAGDKKSELGEKASLWDVSFASGQSRQNAIPGRVQASKLGYTNLKSEGGGFQNRDLVAKYRAHFTLVEKLAEDARALAQDAGTLNDEIKQLSATAGGAVGGARLVAASTKERANNVMPRTLKQSEMKQDYAACADGTPEQQREKVAKGRSLLDQVKADALIEPVADEKAFVRLLEAQQARIKAAAALKPPAGGEQAYATMRKLFDTANQRYLTDSNNLASRTEPDRFTKALTALRGVVDEAAKLLKAHADKLASDLDGVLSKAAERSDGSMRDSETGVGARKLAMDADPMVLRSLKGEQLAKLLKSIRKAPDVGTENPSSKVAHLQTKIYIASAMDEKFLEEDKVKRKAVIEALMADKEELKAARDKWPTMTEPEKLVLFKKIAGKHCAAMNFDPPANVQYTEEKPTTSGGFQRAEKLINLNSKGDTFNDFELMMDSIFHENTHNWQLQLVERIRGQRQPPIAENDPLYQQALLFDANQGDKDEGYDDGAGYKAQPKEAHAHLAGPKMARALMRALSKT